MPSGASIVISDLFDGNFLIFNRVVQQRCYDHIRVTTLCGARHQAGHFEQVVCTENFIRID